MAEYRISDCKTHQVLQKYNLQILPAIVNGMQWYRVSLSNFTNFKKAKSYLSQLASFIPSDSWVLNSQL